MREASRLAAEERSAGLVGDGRSLALADLLEGAVRHVAQLLDRAGLLDGQREGEAAQPELLGDDLRERFSEMRVVERLGGRRGSGRRGGGARVTGLGRELAASYRDMEDKASAAIAGELRRFERRLRKR
jgi:hypothetical protein